MRLSMLKIIVAAIVFTGCNQIDNQIGDEEMAVTAQSVSTTLVSTNVTDSTDVFNNAIRQNYPNGTKYKENYNIYMNTGDDVNVTAYDVAGTYIIGQIVYKDSLVKKCTAVKGDFPKQPEEYASVETSYDNSVWNDRYMKFADIPTGVSVLGRSKYVGITAIYPAGFFVSPDGTKLFVLDINDFGANKIHEFIIINGDISTAVYSGKTANIHVQMRSLFFAPSGLKIYVSNSNNISEFTMSTAWDINTLSLTASKVISTSYTLVNMTISQDGTKLFFTDSKNGAEKVQRFTMSAWTLSTMNTTPDQTIDITSVPVSRGIYGIDVNPDGTKIYIEFYYGSAAPGYMARVEEHTLSTPWDITTYTKTDEYGLKNDYSGEIRLNSTGTSLFEIDASKIYQHTLTTAYDLSTAIYSLLPFTHSEERGGVDYDYILSYASGNYTFRSKVNGTVSSYTPMTAYTELDASSIEDKAYIGDNGTWVAKTVILRDSAIYIRTTVDAAIEYKTLTDYQFSTVISPSQIPGFSFISATNDYKPFDEYGTTQAVSSSPMNYTIETDENFNSFTLVNVVATSLTYTIYDATNTVVKTDTVEIDCLLDDDGLLPQGGVTMMECADTVVAGGKIEIELTNTLGDVKLGGFSANIAVDEGMTLFDIQTGARDYNDYTPDAWGNIPEGVKARTKTFSINVKVPYAKFDRTYRRHLSYLGRFITIDSTDALKNSNDFTLYSLVAKGLITGISHKTEVKNGELEKYYSYNLTFLETT